MIKDQGSCWIILRLQQCYFHLLRKEQPCKKGERGLEDCQGANSHNVWFVPCFPCALFLQFLVGRPTDSQREAVAIFQPFNLIPHLCLLACRGGGRGRSSPKSGPTKNQVNSKDCSGTGHSSDAPRKCATVERRGLSREGLTLTMSS